MTNTGGLLNPADITVTVVPSATGYSLAGPSGGTIGVASTAFTVTLTPGGGAVPAPVTITPSDSGGGGTFTPTTVSLTTVAPSTTFTYTPASAGAKTISATNDGGLTNPGSLTYTAAPFAPSDIAGLKGWWKADALALSDSAAVNPWTDSSGGGFDLALYVSAPIFKTSIVNGKPVVRFDGASNALETTADSIPSSYTVFAVAKAASISAAAHSIVTFGSTSFSNVILRRDTATLNFYQLTAPATYANVAEASGIASGTWNYFTANWDGANIHLWRNGTLKGTSVATTIQTTGSHLGVGFDYQSGAYWDGDIAEVLVYDSALGTTDRQNVEAYLAAKYGL